MTKTTILVATWEDGLFAVSEDGRVEELAGQRVRGLSTDGRVRRSLSPEVMRCAGGRQVESGRRLR